MCVRVCVCEVVRACCRNVSFDEETSSTSILLTKENPVLLSKWRQLLVNVIIYDNLNAERFVIEAKNVSLCCTNLYAAA